MKKLDVTKLSKEFCDQVQAVAAALRGHLTTGAMTPAQKTARAQAGAAKRNQTLSADERKKIASDAAKARWKKQTKAE